MHDPQTTTRSEDALRSLLGAELLLDEPMRRHTTLRVGGPAKWFWAAAETGRLAETLAFCWTHEIPYLLIGHGSNLLMSDLGYDGLVIQNRCKATRIDATGTQDVIQADSGVSLGSLFLQTARVGFSGLEWGVGIPGTVGGALVSNAGAYRGNIGPLVQSIRVFADGHDQTVDPDWMGFAYRDSVLRRAGAGKTVILSCSLRLRYLGTPTAILEHAKTYQEQRKAKQPYDPSAGSFFKNVNDPALAESLPGLPDGLRSAGVVPAGYLIELCGLKGTRVGGAQVSETHANFLVNATRSATASDVRQLAKVVKTSVLDRFGVLLEEEVLYVGKWAVD